MQVSIITAALNAGETIERTIASVLAQTHGEWELLVVDNGSSDETVPLVQRWAARDSRIRLLHATDRGVSHARNQGLHAAQHPWVLFLDADDTLLATALHDLTAALKKQPHLDAVHGAWERIAPNGDAVAVNRWPVEGDLFPFFAFTCVFAIHSCVVRRQALLKVGGFPTDLTTCEDWDLWQRAARAGARFGYANSLVARYHMRKGSASNAGRRLAEDGLTVVRRAHGPDPRVPDPARHWRGGEAPEKLPAALYHTLAWCAGLLIGSGEDATGLLDLVADVRYPDLDPSLLPECILPPVLLPECHKPNAWPEIWPDVEPRLSAYFTALEQHNRVPGLAARAMLYTQRFIADQLEVSTPLLLGTFAAVSIDVRAPLRDQPLPRGVQRLRCRLLDAGQQIGQLELPVFDGGVPQAVLADAIAAHCHWHLLQRFLDHHRPSQLDALRSSLSEGSLAEPRSLLRQLRTRRPTWLCILQDLWDCRRESERALLRGILEQDTRASTRHLDSPRVTIEVTDPPCHLQGVFEELQLRATLGGATLCEFKVKTVCGRIDSAYLRQAVIRHAGKNLYVVAAREALLGKSLATSPDTLRDSLSAISRACLRDNTPRYLQDLPAAWFESDHGSRDLELPPVAFLPHRSGHDRARRALLPAEVGAHLEALSSLSGELLVNPKRRKQRGPTLYLPDLRRCSPDATPHQTEPPILGAQATAVPILMYHRVAPTGVAALSRYRVTPQQFEDQLRSLRRRGYQSVSTETFLKAQQASTPLPGRPILLTFDDGYTDFYEYAYPLLKRYEFSAVVFLVAEQIGAYNAWDSQYGERLSLMTWEQIHELRAADIEFGSHTCRHPFLTSLTPTAQAEELARAREHLVRELGSCETLAYPYGDHDQVTQHLAQACGYRLAVTCEDQISSIEHDPLALPRIEVRGDMSLRYFEHRFELPVHLRALRKLRHVGAHRLLKQRVPTPFYEASKRWYFNRIAP